MGRYCSMYMTLEQPPSFVQSRLAEAREIIGAWCADYNQRRPQSALGYQTRAELAAAWRGRLT